MAKTNPFHGEITETLTGRSGLFVDVNQLPICPDGLHAGAAVNRVSSVFVDLGMPGVSDLKPWHIPSGTPIAIISMHDSNGLGVGRLWLDVDFSSLEGGILGALLFEVLTGPKRPGEKLIFNACRSLRDAYAQAGRMDKYNAAMLRLTRNNQARSSRQ